MIEFDKKLSLTTYLAKAGSMEGKYCVINDETMQNKKTFYSFINGELVFESGGTKTVNWRTTVGTYALVAGITNPLGMDAVIVTVDETHGNNKTWYQHDGYQWNYKGAYQKRETQSFSSLAGIRTAILKTTDSLTLDFEYIVGNEELDVYLDGRIATQYLVETGNVGFTSNLIKFNIDIPISTDINVRKFVPNIDDEPRTNDEVYVNAFKHNYDTIEKYLKYEKSVVIHYETFADVQNDSLLIKEGQVIRTNGHVTKNDGKGRYWILEATDKDFAFKNKANTLFINRLIGADEKPIGEMFMLAGTTVPSAESVGAEGQIANRVAFKRVWAWAVANGRVVTEAEYATNKGCFSSGDLSTTFRFPNPSGEFIRAYSGSSNIDAGRTLGSNQLGTMIFDNTTQTVVVHAANADTRTSEYGTMTINRGGGQSGYNVTSNGHLTRPRNISEKYFIKI